MKFNLNTLKLQLKLLALKAIPEIERRAVDWLATNHEKLGDKRTLALDYIKRQYADATRAIPGLNATTLDDAVVAEYAAEALDWAWAKTGDLINGLTHAPVTDDGTLPSGGVE